MENFHETWGCDNFVLYQSIAFCMESVLFLSGQFRPTTLFHMSCKQTLVWETVVKTPNYSNPGNQNVDGTQHSSQTPDQSPPHPLCFLTTSAITPLISSTIIKSNGNFFKPRFHSLQQTQQQRHWIVIRYILVIHFLRNPSSIILHVQPVS